MESAWQELEVPAHYIDGTRHISPLLGSMRLGLQAQSLRESRIGPCGSRTQGELPVREIFVGDID